MTVEVAAQPVRQVRAQDDGPDMVRYWVLVAAVAHMVLRDRRFHVTIITGAIGALALVELLKNNQARPARRAAAWYKKVGVSQELARARQALEPGQHG
jgi:hypothetical protein